MYYALLYNGNHHCHYLHQHCTSYYFWLQDAKEYHYSKKHKHVQHISELEKKTCQEGGWLAAFYNISKWIKEDIKQSNTYQPSHIEIIKESGIATIMEHYLAMNQ